MKGKNLLNKIWNIVFLLGFVLVPSVLMAAPIPPGPGGSTPSPIDGGIGFLVIAGASYGVKKLLDQNKKSH